MIQIDNRRLNKFGCFYNRYLSKLVPLYAIFSLIFCLIANQIIYFGAQQIVKNSTLHDFSIPLDDKIPLIPCWSIIYLGCYLFWGLNYIIISKQGKENWFKFVTAEYFSKLVCLLFFLIVPSTLARPVLTGTGGCYFLMGIIYGADLPVNLFPSIHCLVSWFCYIGIRGNKSIPLWYRIFSLIFAVLVFLSTLFTRQHVIVDVFGGVILAELCLFLSRKFSVYKITVRLFDKLNQLLFFERQKNG